jgi:hypothetical protein
MLIILVYQDKFSSLDILDNCQIVDPVLFQPTVTPVLSA